MPPNSRKKFRAFLASRRQKLRRPKTAPSFWARLTAKPQAAFRGLLPPASAFVLYLLLLKLEVFTPIERAAHVVAWFLFAVWSLLALRGSVGFWPRWADARFALAIAALIGLGSSWGLGGAFPVKVWVTPPAYARMPSVPLEPPAFGRVFDVLAGSLLHISQPGDAPATLASFAGAQETLDGSGEEEATLSFPVPEVSKREILKLVLRQGWRRVGLWTLAVTPDAPPRIAFTEEPEITARKTIRFAFDASDDHGIEAVSVRVAPLTPISGVPNEPVEIALSAPSVKQARSAGYADLTSLPWAGASVTLQLVATDGAGHKGYSAPKTLQLPTRSFRNPFAKALIEERQKLLGRPEPSVRDEAANVMAGIARQQGLYRGDPVVLMSLRAGAVRLVLNNDERTLPAVQDLLWQTSIRLEEGEVGQARIDLAAAQRDLSLALARRMEREALAPYMARMQQTMASYFSALEAQRAKQPPALQQMDWPLSTASELLTPEDLQARLTTLGPLLDAGDYDAASARLDQLQALIENLRTTPPELTAEQYRIVEQTASLRALVRGQKTLLAETARLMGLDKKSDKGRVARRDGLSRAIAQQQLLLAALRDVAGKIGASATLEARASERAMVESLAALRQKDLGLVQLRQAEALALMENSLLALSEKMRQSLATQLP